MFGETRYYRIPIITKFLKIRLYISWVDKKFHKIGVKKDMSFMEAIKRLESKRLRREKYS